MLFNFLSKTIFLVALVALLPFSAQAQVPAPQRDFLFIGDSEVDPSTPIGKTGAVQSPNFTGVKSAKDGDKPFDIDAPNLRYDTSQNKMIADGGLTIVFGGGVLESTKGEVDLSTNRATLEENVYLSDGATTISADVVNVEIETFEGTFDQCRIDFGDGAYNIAADQGEKLEEEQYKFTNARATTCNCPTDESCNPWYIEADRVEVQKEGYAEAWDATFKAYDVGVFYLPYIIFPAKSERQSGFLPFSIGFGNNTGFQLEAPFFWAIDESSDATITPIIQTDARYGTELQYRERFARDHNLVAGLTYLDESTRGGELLGTDLTGLFDPTIDTDRLAGYLNYKWKGDIANQGFQVIANGRYVSDDLFLREFDTPEIGEFNSRYVNSQAVMRTFFYDTYSAELRAEYSQALVTEDDIVFQRLPQFTIDGNHRFKPFGTNPYGLKLNWSNTLEAVNFARDRGFDGTRIEANESLTVPFHYRNFFKGEFDVNVRATAYSLDDQSQLNSEELLKSSGDRVVPTFTYRMSTVLEKVFEVEDDSFFKTITELGTFGRAKELKRLKHTIEPHIRYQYVPFVNQMDNPQFDTDDRLDQRNVITYGVSQSIFARFDDRNKYKYGIEETAPEVDDLGTLESGSVLDGGIGLEEYASDNPNFNRPLPRATVKELLRLDLSQSFDILEEQKDRDEDRDGLRDLATELVFLPNNYVSLRTKADYDIESLAFRSYSVESQLLDKRGDILRTRLTYRDPSVRQLENSLEIRVSERVKFGYYTRYDDLEAEFLENRAGVRLASTCNCWLFDVEFVDRLNPDRTEVNFILTLVGLGEFGNSIFSRGNTAN